MSGFDHIHIPDPLEIGHSEVDKLLAEAAAAKEAADIEASAEYFAAEAEAKKKEAAEAAAERQKDLDELYGGEPDPWGDINPVSRKK
jgi:nucleotide-binding universal stress UspA family protein